MHTKNQLQSQVQNSLTELIYIKFGGSVITQKDTPLTHRPEIIARLAREFASLRRQKPEAAFLIGNGAGSYGHYKVIEYGMKQGIQTPEQVFGYCDVHASVQELNALVVAALLKEGIPACSIQPSAIFTAEDGTQKSSYFDSLRAQLETGIVPVVYGDIILDEKRGSVVFSTEDIFAQLLETLPSYSVSTIIHVSNVEGVLKQDTTVIPQITRDNWEEVQSHIYTGSGFDVTGGMKHKIETALSYATRGITTRIISGEVPDTLDQVFTRPTGTVIQ
jgi:isopentenyl phosphate kinase